MNTIKIAQWGGRHIAYMPLYVADRLGLFRELGIEVTIYSAGNDNEIFMEVAKGRAQIGIGDPAFVALGHAQGHDTRVIAAVINRACAWGITHHPEIKPLTQVSDFVGLRIGTFPKPSTAYTIMSAMKARHSRMLKNMQIIETEIGQQAYLLAADQVDLILELEPMVSLAARQGLRIVCNMGEFYPEMLFTGLMTSQNFIAAHPETVGKIVLGFQQGLAICHRQPEKAVAIGCELFPAISSNIMSEAVQRMIQSKMWPTQAVVLPAAWNNALKLRQDVGELDELPPFDAVVDQRFAFAALA